MVIREKRKQEILSLRVQGYTFFQIGQDLTPKLTSVRIQQIVAEALDEVRRESAEHARDLAVRRIELMLPTALAQAVEGNPLAQASVLRMIDVQATILGLHAPTKVENSGPGGGPQEHHVAVSDASASFNAKALAVLDKMRSARETKA